MNIYACMPCMHMQLHACHACICLYAYARHAYVDVGMQLRIFMHMGAYGCICINMNAWQSLSLSIYIYIYILLPPVSVSDFMAWHMPTYLYCTSVVAQCPESVAKPRRPTGWPQSADYASRRGPCEWCIIHAHVWHGNSQP